MLAVIALVLGLVNLAGLLYIFLSVFPKFKEGFKKIESGMKQFETSIKAIYAKLYRGQ